jgi:hypothetical protein
MTKLDVQIGVVGKNVQGAADEWGLNLSNEKLGALGLSRGSFSRTDKITIGDQHKSRFSDLLVEGKSVPSSKIKKDGTFKSGAKLARRHVVSSQDMIDHFQGSLQDKTVPEARILISERSSIAEARVPIPDKAGVPQAREAAKRRYNGFFSYAHNLFIGNAETNSSLGRLLDTNHPGLVGKAALDNHLARIKREWSFGTGFSISTSEAQDTVVD